MSLMTRTVAAPLLLLSLALASCASTPNPGNETDRSLLHIRTSGAIADFKAQDPSMDAVFKDAYAYAVFPRIVTAAVGIGGAHGDGEVYQKGQFVGYADVTQASVGAQLGAQRYAEIVFFQNESAFVEFKYGSMEFDARATAVAASEGAATAANYRHGVLVFTLPESGLMAQAAIGTQKFRFEPAKP